MKKRLEIYCDDVTAIVPRLERTAVDGILADPPYEIGFCGRKWDSTGVALSREVWKGMLHACKPAAPLLVFGASRTWHRLACAIEDAGWEIRDTLQWIRSNGVPKARNSDMEEQRAGYSTSLKPGHDPIILARKPLDGSATHNMDKWCCGLLNVSACRIPCKDKERFPKGEHVHRGIFHLAGKHDRHPESRYPANVLLDEEAARLLDEQHVGASRFFYCTRATARERDAGLPPGMKNDHPCVKPLGLCKYLATLLLPPARETPRRLLVPFSGTGSEIIGALLAGWDEVIGIEIDKAYVTVAEQRIGHWVNPENRRGDDTVALGEK